jgi:hypothetical protein
MAGDHWMGAARERMKKRHTEGLFGRKAAAAGMSTPAYASKEYDAPGDLGKEARFAYVAEHGHGKDSGRENESPGRRRLRRALTGRKD